MDLNPSSSSVLYTLYIPNQSLLGCQHVDVDMSLLEGCCCSPTSELEVLSSWSTNDLVGTDIEKIAGNSTITQVEDSAGPGSGHGSGKSNGSSHSADELSLLIIRESECTRPPSPSNQNTNEEESEVNDDGEDDEKNFPKPPYSTSCLIAMALKNSHTGCLPVSEIYWFALDHFPYFQTAASGFRMEGSNPKFFEGGQTF